MGERDWFLEGMVSKSAFGEVTFLLKLEKWDGPTYVKSTKIISVKKKKSSA